MSLRGRAVWSVGFTALALVVLVGSRIPASPPHPLAGEGVEPGNLLGLVLADSVLPAMSAGQFHAERSEPRARLVYVVPVERSADCTRIPMEMRIVARRFPRLHQALVLTGPDTVEARRFARENRVSHDLRLDPTYRLARSLGLRTTEPVVILLDGENRIVFVDARAGGNFSTFPISRVLPVVSAILGDAATEQ